MVEQERQLSGERLRPPVKVILDAGIVFAGLGIKQVVESEVNESCAEILQLVEAGEIVMYVDGRIISEMNLVAGRLLKGRSDRAEKMEELRLLLKTTAIDVSDWSKRRRSKIRACDVEDEKYLEVFTTARADWIISSDFHLKSMGYSYPVRGPRMFRDWWRVNRSG